MALQQRDIEGLARVMDSMELSREGEGIADLLCFQNYLSYEVYAVSSIYDVGSHWECLDRSTVVSMLSRKKNETAN